MATDSVEAQAQVFVDEKEAELSKRYTIDGEDAQRAWQDIVKALPADAFMLAVVAELAARGYLDEKDAEILRLRGRRSAGTF
jgi:hypothetical protein